MGTGKTRTLGRRVAAGSIMGMGANVVFLASRLALTPFILAYVSLADFGLWSVCFIVLSYAGLTAFGIQNAYVKYVAQYNAEGNLESASVLVSTGLVVMTGVSLLLFAALLGCVPLFMTLFDIDPGLRELAGFMILGTAAAFLLDLTFSAFRGVLEGMQEIVLSRSVWLAATLLELALVFVFLPLGYGIRGVLYAYALKTVFEVLVNMFFAFRKVPGLRVGPRYVRREALHALFVFGGKVQFLGVLGIFLGTFDRIVTTAMLGLSATGLFEVARKLPFTGRSITGAAFVPFLPAASSLGGDWLKSPAPTVQQKFRKYVALCLLALVGSCFLIAPLAFYDWQQRGYGWSEPSFWAMCLSIFLIFFPGIQILAWLRRFIRGGEYLESPKLVELYLTGCRHINLVNFTLYAFLAAAANELLYTWLGTGYDGAEHIMRVICIVSLVHLATGAGTAVFKGVNRTGRELEYTLMQLVLALLWIPGLAWSYGLYGAVLGVALSTIPPSLYFIVRTNQALRIAWREYFVRTVLPGFAPILSGGLVWLVLSQLPQFSRWTTLFVLGGLGLGYLIVTAFLLWALFVTQEEMGMVRNAFSRLRAKLRG